VTGIIGGGVEVQNWFSGLAESPEFWYNPDNSSRKSLYNKEYP